MSLRLFRGGGGGRGRTCPACEERVDADATFCPSCYMVFRPEGAADLRQHLHGSRIPADVYLRRKMQAVDPDLGPVMPVSPAEQPAPLAAPSVTTPASATPAAPAPAEASEPMTAPPSPAQPRAPLPAGGADPLQPRRAGVRSLAEFEPPLPPPARSADEVQGVLAWMLEHDPLIPNNVPRLEAIHAAVFHGAPAGRLGYREHVILQVGDDLGVHDGEEALQAHLECLAGAYRRAALSYGRAAGGRPEELDGVLWRMASFASRLRVESWIYQSRHGAPPQLLAAARRPRPRQKH